MGIEERKKREKKELKTMILEAAIELIINDGYENLTMRKIAKKINYSATTIYLYFKDKKDLILSIAELGHSIFKNRLKDKYKNIEDNPLLKLKVAIETYIDMAMEYPEQYKISFQIDLGEEKNVISNLLNKKSLSINKDLDFLKLPIEECVNKKIFKQIDVELVSQTLYSAIHGLASFLILEPNININQKQDLVYTLINSYFYGITGE